MDSATRSLIAALHQASRKYALALTGGGATAIGELLSVPGGSRTILEAVVPYAQPALTDYLGRAPEQYCSAATSLELAQRASERAAALAPGEAVLGIGCTASLASDRPKRGDHRFHVAFHGGRAVTYSLTLRKGERDREGEENVLRVVLLNGLAEYLSIAERLPLPLLPGEAVEIEPAPDTAVLAGLLRGESRAVCSDIDGRLRADALLPAALLPGSFNPLHHGHRELATVAGELLGVAVAFELTVVNADKAPLSPEAAEQRRRQFLWRAPLWLTSASTFVEKAAIFPGATFIVGADTAARIVAPRFYQDSEALMLAALARIRELGCRFLVAGRVDTDGNFTRCEDLALPAEFRDLFAGIPPEAFRHDVSSTDLRRTN
jgi:hypothetical protein